jgi:hypothetical protein
VLETERVDVIVDAGADVRHGKIGWAPPTLRAFWAV